MRPTVTTLDIIPCNERVIAAGNAGRVSNDVGVHDPHQRTELQVQLTQQVGGECTGAWQRQQRVHGDAYSRISGQVGLGVLWSASGWAGVGRPMALVRQKRNGTPP